ncbi:MAG: alpha-N-arabinofuranosidase, partial [Spirochaetota bacterium]
MKYETDSIDINNKQNFISPFLYGSFAEHLGKCIYGGIWVGEKSSIKNERGFRIDV